MDNLNMETWSNGDRGKVVKEVIDNNFKILNSRVSQLEDKRVLYFPTSKWKNGTIFIEYSAYNKSNPCVDVYIKNSTGYSFVYGGYEIRDNGIELQSDIPYECKVVIR